MITLGAVAYDSKVVTIWDGFRAWFETKGLEFDYVLYTNYERQVDAQCAGQLDAAWNSPLAWLQTLAKRPDAHAIAMRDTDRDLTSAIVVRDDSPIRTLADLRGKRVGVGATDSPQATLIPLVELAEAGLDIVVQRHDVLVGKHGDHIGGERDAAKALLAGSIDAACVLDANRVAFSREGLGPLRVVHQTGAFDHCNMTVLEPNRPDLVRFRELLLAMSYDDPVVRPLLDLEGLKQWLPGRTSGYGILARAVKRFGWRA